jgi:guanylate kinase
MLARTSGASWTSFHAGSSRLRMARQEIAQWKNFDYLIISGSIAEDLRRMISIYEAERMRPAISARDS